MLEILKQHTKQNPIGSEALRPLLNLTGREIRHEIEALRRQGHPIGSNSIGYYYAQDYRELEQAVSRYKKQILTMLKTYGQMKRQLRTYGQMELLTPKENLCNHF